jgi:HlyD family secretion protein
MRTRYTIGIIALSFLGGLFLSGIASEPEPAPAVSGARAAEKSPRVVVGAGRVEAASEEVEICAELPGRLKAVHVDEGDTIAAGQVLAELENADYRARIASAGARLHVARAELHRLINGARQEERDEARAAVAQAAAVADQARAELERRSSLIREGVIPREELERADRDMRVARARLDELSERHRLVEAAPRSEDVDRARATVAAAEADLAEARSLFDKTLIRSPLTGVVLRRHLLGGESVTFSPEPTPILTVADTRRLRVRVDVDETDVSKVALGQRAWVTADAYGSTRFNGRVVQVGEMLGRKNVQTDDPREREDTKVLEVLVELDPGQRLPIALRVDAFLAVGGQR